MNPRPSDDHGPNVLTFFSQLAPVGLVWWRDLTQDHAATPIIATPSKIWRAAITVSGRRGEREVGTPWARSVNRNSTTKMPTAQPTRNGSAARERLGESRMKMLAMTGTELRAAASAIGRIGTIACTVPSPFD
jgi:hypothetical protein